MMSKELTKVSAGAVVVMGALAAWVVFGANTPERQQKRIEIQLGTLSAEDKKQAAEREREAADCASSAQKLGEQHETVRACRQALVEADAIRSHKSAERAKIVEALNAQLAKLKAD